MRPMQNLLVFVLVVCAMAVGCGPSETPSHPAPGKPESAGAQASQVQKPTAPAPTAEGPFLLKDGKSNYEIVVAATASPSEKRAAEEIQANFKACTSVELPIVERASRQDVPTILVGCGPAAEALGVTPKADELGTQGYVLKTVPPHIVIAGTAASGTLYGAYDFIETVLGVRWYAPGVTKTPTLKEIKLPELAKTFKPSMTWRLTSYEWPGGDDAFRAHQRENNGNGTADNALGQQYYHDGRCHSYFRYIDPDEFFATHPEYFSEIGGIRRDKETQLCLTNPDVLKIVTERMLKRMAEDPGAQQHNFSQMDYYNYCECAECTKINQQYGTLGGTQFWFVNKLAEQTSAIYPDKLIGTLAYMYTEEPPKEMKMHPNVAVWLCHMYPSCQSHPISTCEFNADFKRRAQAWSQLCSHLYIWYYVVDFAHYYNPYPNLLAMASDLKFFQDIGVEGVYEQGMGHKGGGGEFSLLRPYFGMKLLWDPNQDPDAVIRDFLDGYYGSAGKPIGKYITMLHDKVQDENIHMHLYTNPAQGYLPDPVLAKARELFDQAETAVKDNPELLERVRVARMPLTYARIFPRNGYKIENGMLAFQGDIAPMEETQAFIDRMKQHGFETIREWGGDPQQLQMWTMAGSMPLPLATIKNDLVSVDIMPFLGGRALRIMDSKTGQCATAYNVTRNLFFPFVGGEESRLGGMFAASMGGNLELYNVVEQTENTVVLEADVLGFKLRRTFTLVNGKPAVQIKADVTNPSDKPKTTILRSHLELDMGELPKTEVAFTSLAGEQVKKNMEPIIAGLREGEYYRKQNAPKNEWTFTGTKGLQLTQRFNSDQIDFTQLYAYPSYLGELEVEVWLKETSIAPNETMTFSQEIEVKAIAP